jgi:hypothetical protein
MVKWAEPHSEPRPRVPGLYVTFQVTPWNRDFAYPLNCTESVTRGIDTRVLRDNEMS